MYADPTFRAFAITVAPAMAGLNEAGWSAVGATIGRALAHRPARMLRQLRLLLLLIEHVPRVLHGRPFTALGGEQRALFVQRLERSPLKLVRRGVWGLRTLVLMGYYTMPETMQQLGYHADPGGWSVRLPPQEAQDHDDEPVSQ